MLGVFACVALFWGAVDLVGVPPENLFARLLEVSVGLGAVIALALAPAALIVWWKRRRRH